MTENASSFFVHDNIANGRFELHEKRADHENIVSFASYERHGNTVIVPHVETDPQRRGEGFADQLMAGLLDQIEATASLIVPLCPFAAAYIAERAERRHLLVSDKD
jgi:predicted GNAT family acetyltransferase